MSECVVRMEMPNGCHDCKLRNMVGNCPIPIFDGQDEKKIWTLEECFQRPPWCPIICSLPEGHGRLVEEKSVRWAIDDIVLEIANRTGRVWMTKDETMEYINNLCTIVPADTAERSEK